MKFLAGETNMSGNSHLNQTFKSKEGLLGFAEYGDSKGKPVIHFHGQGSSRFEGQFFDEKASQYGVRFIVLERPGYGLSTFRKWQLLSWPDDVIAFANHLNFESFAVSGMSGGAPHALACAYKTPDRITTCAVISTIGPPEVGFKSLPRILRLSMFAAKRVPFLYKLILKTRTSAFTNPEKLKNYVKKKATRIPKGDLDLFSDDANVKLYTDMMSGGIRQGVDAPVHETKLLGNDWGFSLKDVVKKVTMWHGEKDAAVKQVQTMSVLLPNCETHFYPDQGHISVVLPAIDDIMQSLLA